MTDIDVFLPIGSDGDNLEKAIASVRDSVGIQTRILLIENHTLDIEYYSKQLRCRVIFF